MLDRLIDLLIASLQAFQFWVVIDDFERGVVLRLGRFQRELQTGLYWLVPFYVDQVLVDNVVPRTKNLGAQSLTTKDGKQVVVAAIVTARINDVRKALLEVEGVDEALVDSCYAEVGRVVREKSLDMLQHDDLTDELTAACRKRARRYGVEIMQVQLSDIALCRSLRLWSQQ